MLLNQDKLCVLEQKLEKIDQEETSPLFLGMSRLDRNPAKQDVLSEIESSLAEYDAFVERTHRCYCLRPAIPETSKVFVTSLRGRVAFPRSNNRICPTRENLHAWLRPVIPRYFTWSHGWRTNFVSCSNPLSETYVLTLPPGKVKG